MTEEKQKPVVLLVAKSANSQKLVAKHLRSYFGVVTAADAESAWDCLQKNRKIVLIIGELDLVIDKFGLLERLRGASDCTLAATPLLLMVGANHTDSDRELAFQAGATDFSTSNNRRPRRKNSRCPRSMCCNSCRNETFLIRVRARSCPSRNATAAALACASSNWTTSRR
jgi:CheY-like chemotaxis protein